MDIWKNVMRYLSEIFALINNFCDTNVRKNFNLQLINTVRTSFVIIHDDANDNNKIVLNFMYNKIYNCVCIYSMNYSQLRCENFYVWIISEFSKIEILLSFKLKPFHKNSTFSEPIYLLKNLFHFNLIVSQKYQSSLTLRITLYSCCRATLFHRCAMTLPSTNPFRKIANPLFWRNFVPLKLFQRAERFLSNVVMFSPREHQKMKTRCDRLRDIRVMLSTHKITAIRLSTCKLYRSSCHSNPEVRYFSPSSTTVSFPL